MMLNLFYISICTVLCCCHVTADIHTCQDLDPNSCVLMASQNPSMCSDPTLSTSVCPKFCNNCPLVCYSCDSNDTDISHCNPVTCSSGQMCIVWSKVGTKNSPSIYKMRCGAKTSCTPILRRDSDVRHAPVVTNKQYMYRRDVYNLKCCDTDLCNLPLSQKTISAAPTTIPTTTTSTTATTTTSLTTVSSSPPTSASTNNPTVPQHSLDIKTASCKRDVIFMISLTGHDLEFMRILAFVGNIIHHLKLGRNQVQVGLGTFQHYHCSTQLDLDRGINESTLFSALFGLSSDPSSDASNIQAVRYVLENFQKGNRLDADDVIIFISNGHAMFDFWNMPHGELMSNLDQRSPNVITIGYGEVNQSQMLNIATDPSHYIYNTWDRNSDAFQTLLLKMICS